jgi:hypothetical protein
MANLEIPVEKDGTGIQTLNAGQVDTVTIEAGASASRSHGPRDLIRVIGHGDDDVYVTFDGQDPLVDGTVGYRLPAATVAALEERIKGGAGATVKVLSATAATYSVEVA